VEEDSFWAPHEVLLEIQSFLADHEDLYSTRTMSETAVVFSVPSAFEHQEAGGGRDFAPFFAACDALVRQRQPFDVVMFPEGELRPDAIELGDLAQYRTLVLPWCTFLTTRQVAVLRALLDRGGRVLATGETGSNLTSDDRATLVDHRLWRRVDDVRTGDLSHGPQVVIDDDAPDLAINLQRAQRGVAVHVIRYDYDDVADRVPILPELVVRVRLPWWYRNARVFTPASVGARVVTSRPERGMHRLELEDVPVYSVTLLQG
jgi:hypothetical protein